MLPDVIPYVPDPKNGRPIADGQVFFLLGGYTPPGSATDVNFAFIAEVTADGIAVPQPIFTSKGGTLLVGSQSNQPQLEVDPLVRRVAVYDKCGRLVYSTAYNGVGPFVSADALAATDSTTLVAQITAARLARKFEDFPTIKDYATLDFAGDFSTALTDALAANVGVIVPSGDYLLENPVISNQDNACVYLMAGARLYYTDPLMTPLTFNGVNSKVVGEGMIEAPAIFDGANVPPTYSVIRFNADGGEARGITIRNIPKIGIWYKDANNGKVSLCTLDGGTTEGFFDGTNTVHAGIWIDVSGAGSQGNFSVTANEISNVVQGGCSGNFGGVSFEQAMAVSGNVFENCWNHGWYTPGLGNGHNISGNAFNRCQVPVALTGRNHVVSGNTMVVQTVGTGDPNEVECTGISLRNPKSCIVTGNTLIGSAPVSGAVIDLQYNAGVPGDPDVVDNIVANNVLEINNPATAGSVLIRIISTASLLARNAVFNNTLKGTIRSNNGLITVTGSASFDNEDNTIEDNSMTITGSTGNGYSVFLSNLIDASVIGNKTRLAFDSASAIVIWCYALNVCSNCEVDGNKLSLTASFGDDINLRGFAELGACLDNQFNDNKFNVDATKLTAFTQFLLSGTSGSTLRHLGTGTPEGAVIAAIGSEWRRKDGGAGTTLYIKESGTSNTGWVAK